MKKSTPQVTKGAVALDPKAQAVRYGRSWMTLSQRWMEDLSINYPRPDFYVGKTPFTYLTTLEAWEASRPSVCPGRAVIRRSSDSKAA